MSTWLFDLGNTRLKFAPLDAIDAAAQALPHAGYGIGALPDDVHGELAVVASVAPAGVRVALLTALAMRFRLVVQARTLAHCGRLTIAYADPGALGVDRFLALLAASTDVEPQLLVGVGTALTIDALQADGRHAGGLIAPSPTLMREALAARSARLPATGGMHVPFAGNTLDALASGCDGAAIALVREARHAFAAQAGTLPRLRMHGGGAPALRDALGDPEPWPSPVLHGLAAWVRATGVA